MSSGTKKKIEFDGERKIVKIERTRSTCTRPSERRLFSPVSFLPVHVVYETRV